MLRHHNHIIHVYELQLLTSLVHLVRGRYKELSVTVLPDFKLSFCL